MPFSGLLLVLFDAKAVKGPSLDPKGKKKVRHVLGKPLAERNLCC